MHNMSLFFKISHLIYMENMSNYGICIRTSLWENLAYVTGYNVALYRVSDCKDEFPSVQFENLWQKDLLDLANNGFAKTFSNLKFKPTKFGNRLKVAVIGSGPAGNLDYHFSPI